MTGSQGGGARRGEGGWSIDKAFWPVPPGADQKPQKARKQKSLNRRRRKGERNKRGHDKVVFPRKVRGRGRFKGMGPGDSKFA